MIKYLIILIVFNSFAVCAQSKSERYAPDHSKYMKIMEEPGNPLPGNPLLIINYFAEKEGSYLFFLNEVKAKVNSGLSESPTDLYAGLYLEDHGGVLERVTFKDFAGLLSQPKYLLKYCVADDADDNKSPEFYLTYFEESDGLDAKPLKVIIYFKKDKIFVKSKLTAWIPFQPEDRLKIEKDENFKKLPQNIQKKANELLNKAQYELM